MSISKKIISESVESLIKNEGILDIPKNLSSKVAGFAGGIKNTGAGMMGNYRLGNINAQMKQFADKTKKQWNVNKQQALKTADKMTSSSNKAVARAGDTIKQQVSVADDELNKLADTIVNTTSTAIINPGSASDSDLNKMAIQRQFKDPEFQKHLNAEIENRAKPHSFEKWVKDEVGLDPLGLTDKQIAVLYRSFSMKKPKAAQANENPGDLQALKQIVQSKGPPPLSPEVKAKSLPNVDIQSELPPRQVPSKKPKAKPVQLAAGPKSDQPKRVSARRLPQSKPVGDTILNPKTQKVLQPKKAKIYSKKS